MQTLPPHAHPPNRVGVFVAASRGQVWGSPTLVIQFKYPSHRPAFGVSRTMVAAVPPVSGIDPVPHLEWSRSVALAVARQYGFHRTSQEAEDLASAAALSLVQAARSFAVTVRAGSNLLDCFRGCTRRSIVRDCSREAMRITGGGAEVLRTGKTLARLIRVGGLDDADDVFPSAAPSLYEFPTEEPYPMPPVPPSLPADVPEIEQLKARAIELRGEAAAKEAEANAIDEAARIFAPLATLLQASPALRSVFSSVLMPVHPIKPRGRGK